MNHADALRIAEEWVERLRPACTRIEIKGSICRLKAEPKDIELLAIPDETPLPRPRPEFGKPYPTVYKTMLDKLIAELRDEGVIFLEKCGPRYKKFVVKEHKISVDLFICLPPAMWGVQSLIRTGPSDFSHWVVTRRRRGGVLQNGYRVQDGAVWEGENEVKDLEGQTCVGFESERDFMEWLGLGWIEPCERVAKWAR